MDSCLSILGVPVGPIQVVLSPMRRRRKMAMEITTTTVMASRQSYREQQQYQEEHHAVSDSLPLKSSSSVLTPTMVSPVSVKKIVSDDSIASIEASSSPLLRSHRDSLLVLMDKLAHQIIPSSLLSTKQQSLMIGKFGFHGAITDSDDEEDDDDTATTLSSTSVSLDEDPACRHVHFASPLITSIHTRPYTTKAEKSALFYTEFEYMEFKIDFLTGRSNASLSNRSSTTQERTKVVSFQEPSIVTTIHTFVPPTTPEEKQRLYYTEVELQTFLDDFVLSLNQRMEVDC